MEYRKRVAYELRNHVDLLDTSYAIAQIAESMAVGQDGGSNAARRGHRWGPAETYAAVWQGDPREHGTC